MKRTWVLISRMSRNMSVGSVDAYKQAHQAVEKAVEQLKIQTQQYEVALNAFKEIPPTDDRRGASFKAVSELGRKLESLALSVEHLVAKETAIIQTYQKTGWRAAASKLGFSIASSETQQALRIQALAKEVRLVARNTQEQLASGKIQNTTALLTARVGRLQGIDQSWPQAKPSWKSYFAALFKSIGGSRAPSTQATPPRIVAASPPSRPNAMAELPRSTPVTEQPALPSSPPATRRLPPPPPARDKARPSAPAVSSPPKPEPSPWSKEEAMWSTGMNWVDDRHLPDIARGLLQSLFEPAMRLLGPVQGEATLKHLRSLEPKGWQQLFAKITPKNYESVFALRDFILLVTSSSPEQQERDPSSPEQQERDFQFSLDHMDSSKEAEAARDFVNALSPEARKGLLEKMIQKGVDLSKPSLVLDFLQVESLTAQSSEMISSEEARVLRMLEDERLFTEKLASTYERVECSGTGNCMYEAFARGLRREKPKEAAEELRQELYEHMNSALTAKALREEALQLGGFGGVPEAEFAQEVAKVKDREAGVEAWADSRHVRVLAQKYKVRVHVHTFFNGEDVVSHLNPDGRAGSDIHLFYSQRHYDYMRPL